MRSVWQSNWQTMRCEPQCRACKQADHHIGTCNQWQVAALPMLQGWLSMLCLAHLNLAAQLCFHLPAVQSRAWPLCPLADLSGLSYSPLVQGPAHASAPFLPL